MSRVFALLLVAFVALAAVVYADVPYADCNIDHLDLFRTNPGPVPGSLLETIPLVYEITDYNLNLAYVFPTDEAYIKITLVPESLANYTLRVNGGVEGPIFPYTNNELHLIDGLIPGCGEHNTIYIRSEQNSTIPNRVKYCEYLYILHLTSPDTCCTGVCGDPQFKGLRGQSYQIHGIDGAVYNIISAKEYIVNSQFVFLTGPRECPIIPTTGKRSVACWSHDGSYLQNLAVRTATNDVIVIESGAASTGFSSVVINGKQMEIDETVQYSQGSISFNSTHEVTLQVGQFLIEVENNNEFLNLRSVHVSAGQWASLAADNGVHGLLGQTWRSKHYSGKVKEIEGEVDDYSVVGGLLDSDFIFNRLQTQ